MVLNFVAFHCRFYDPLTFFALGAQIFVTETMFEYYFREGDAAVESTSDVTLRVDLLNPRKDRPEDGNELWYPRPRRGRKRYQSYGPPPPDWVSEVSWGRPFQATGPRAAG